MITVNLRHFAQLRERRGAEREQLQVEAGTTLRGLYGTLFDRIDEGPLPVACLRNQAQASPDEAVADGDEVAFLPPFGGG